MNSYFISLLLFFDVMALEIVTFVNNSDTHLNVFSNNKTASEFLFQKRKCCLPNSLYHEIYSPLASANFTLFKEDNDILPLNEIALVLNSKHNITDRIVTYGLMGNPNIIQLQLFNICSIDPQSETQLAGGGMITVLFNLNNINHHFDYFHLCDNNKNASPGVVLRIVNIALILLLMTVIIFVSTHFTLDTDLITEFKEKLNFDWKYGLVVFLISLLSLFLLSSLKTIIQNVISIGMICILIGTVYLTSASLAKTLLHLELFPIKLKEYSKKEVFSIKTYKAFSIIFSLGLVSLWIINPNWVLLNGLLFTCVFASVSLLSIPNYQSLTLICLFFTLYDLFLICCRINYTKIIEEIDQPIKFLLPKFSSNDIYNPCYFISLIDIVMVSFFVKYSKCFDVVKGIISYAYYKSSIYIYLAGLILTIITQLCLKTNQVFLFPLELLLLLGLIVKAISKRELKDFWNGENAEGIHKAVSDIISNKTKNEDKNDVRYVRKYNDDNSAY